MTERLSKTFPRDLLASLVVFMVALPLCIAIAKASGLSTEAGIVTGIIGGLVVAPLAGSPLQVSGPAAGLIVLVLAFVNNHKEALARGETAVPVAAALGAAALLGGLMQVGMAGLKLGKWFRAVSPAVVMGMLGGIGVVIIAKQVHEMIDDHPAAAVAHNITSIPSAVEKAFTDPAHRPAAAAGLVTLVLLVAWNYVPKTLKVLPGALIAVVAGTLVAEGLGLHAERISVQSNLLDGLTWFQVGSAAELLRSPAVWGMAATIAVIASAETMLSSTAVDQMHDGPRTKHNKELFAQGIGNAVSGLVGALPLTGVIVRSSANVTAGAKTRLSAALHGVWLLGFVALLPWALELVPEACLAAVLVYTGFKLIALKQVKRLWAEDRWEVAIFVATLVGVVATDLLKGVLLGVGLSVAKLLWTMSRLEIDTVYDKANRGVRVTLRGAATFVSLPKLADALDAVPRGWAAAVRLEDMTFVDHACLRLLQDWEKQRGGDGVIEWGATAPASETPAAVPSLQ